ncbi:MAG TPA: hypothetical protein ENG09_03470 [Candidatus Syntrophoarchaeum butanivorans]|uniref:Uncharacterized protein n=1 Tax=Candidatus Syntropharchaeum butanivorans TaxID=1839936 RepID=A0A7C1B3P6_9EURY|nr:MAG: hypothetical protein CW694_06515 [Candidatus Syntrophoarchaeum sp. WYZ-LMO15]HDM36299.1 hypothetical protein [Candidatus Syntrophoarchaeum butanivorans]HEC57442.1 hypothetical protein [Candidatus Syntrophoarchaeum butanivorans]
MSRWLWPQPDKKNWLVVTDVKKGIIRVYNEKGDLLTEKKDLSEVVVRLIEKNFFDTVGIKLSELGDPLNPVFRTEEETGKGEKKGGFVEPDPMFA